MNENSGWEALPPRSPLAVRAEAVERFSCQNIQTHTHSRHVYTRVHVHSPTEPRVIQLGSCVLLHCFSTCYPLLLDSFHLFLLSSHLLDQHPRSDRPQQWRHGGKQNSKPKPHQRGVPLVFVHCQLTRIHLRQHTRIFTLWPDGKSW